VSKRKTSLSYLTVLSKARIIALAKSIWCSLAFEMASCSPATAPEPKSLSMHKEICSNLEKVGQTNERVVPSSGEA